MHVATCHPLTGQRGRGGGRERQIGPDHGTHGVVDVRLAVPGAARHLQPGRQLVVPGAVLVVDEVVLHLLPPGRAAGGVRRVPSTPGERVSRLDRLRDDPVEALLDHRPPGPVRGVAQPVGGGPLEQGDRSRQEPAGRLAQRRFELNRQSRPLEAMSRRGAVRPERVGRALAVVLGQRLPVCGEVLDDAPVVIASHCDQAFDDGQGALAPAGVTGHVGSHEVGLDGVHVAVGATVVLDRGEGLVPGLSAGAVRLVPEALQVHGGRLFEEGLGAVDPGRGGRGGGEEHEAVVVAALRAIGDLAVDRHLVEPPPGIRVGEAVAQGAYAVRGEVDGARAAEQRGQREHVGHPRVDPHLQPGRRSLLALVVEPREAVFGHRPLREGEERGELVGAPGRRTGRHARLRVWRNQARPANGSTRGM